LIAIALRYSKKNVENRFEPQYVADLKVPYTIEEEVDITLVDANNKELDMGHHLIFLGRGQPWLC
jgi:hypothetical protein